MNRKYFSTKSPTLSASFIAKVRATATGDLTYLASARVDEGLWEIAVHCATARQLLAERRKLRGAKYDRRDKSNPDSAAATRTRNIRVHTLGCVGELLLAELMPSTANIAPLVAHKFDDGADAIYDELSIDSKTTDVGASKIYINGAAHNKKRPSHYFVVHLVRDDVADIYLVTAGTVETWEYQGWRAAPCYVSKAPAIDPTSLPERLPELTA